MRIVWESPAAPTTFTDPRNGRKFSGKYRVKVALYEAGDPLTRLHEGRPIALTRTVLSLRAQAGIGAPVRAEPLPDRMPVDPVMIPDAVFASLPQNANVAISWEFVPEAAL